MHSQTSHLHHLHKVLQEEFSEQVFVSAIFFHFCDTFDEKNVTDQK